MDHDALELSNLQRQVIHSTARIGRNKAESAAETLAALNPEVRVEPHALRMDAAAARDLIPRYDLVCDGTDNFATRFLLGDACHLLGRTLVSAAVLRFEGQLSTFKAHRGPPHPCHRCLHPEPPPPGLVPSCSEAGVLGAVTGVMGTLQATEALKEVLGIGEGMSGRLLLWDALDARFRTVRLRRDPGCALCGEAATIRDLSAHAAPARPPPDGEPAPPARRAAHLRRARARALRPGARHRRRGARPGRGALRHQRRLPAVPRPTPLLAEPARSGAAKPAASPASRPCSQAASELGLRRIACEAGLQAEDLAGHPLAPGVEVAGVVTFLSAVGDGQMVSGLSQAARRASSRTLSRSGRCRSTAPCPGCSAW